MLCDVSIVLDNANAALEKHLLDLHMADRVQQTTNKGGTGANRCVWWSTCSVAPLSISGLTEFRASQSTSANPRKRGRGVEGATALSSAREVVPPATYRTIAFAWVLPSADIKQLQAQNKLTEYFLRAKHVLQRRVESQRQRRCCVFVFPLLSRGQSRQSLAAAAAEVAMLDASPSMRTMNDHGVTPSAWHTEIDFCSWEVMGSVHDVVFRINHIASYFAQGKHEKQRDDRGHCQQRGQRKRDALDFHAVYRAMLCEVQGVSARRASAIAAAFPTLDALLCSIVRGDCQTILSRAIGYGEDEKQVGDALAETIIAAMTRRYVDGTQNKALTRMLRESASLFGCDRVARLVDVDGNDDDSVEEATTVGGGDDEEEDEDDEADKRSNATTTTTTTSRSKLPQQTLFNDNATMDVDWWM